MKKIMTVVLALAVIFGFSACSDGSTISYYGEKVLSVTVASAPEYIAGETLNPADVTLRVVYDQGSDKTFKASELGMRPDTENSKTFTLEEGKNTFYVSYGRDESDKDAVKAKVWPITINAAKLENIVVDASKAATTIVKGEELDTTGVVYTAIANGKEVLVSETLAHELADFKLSAVTTSADEGDVITVSATGTDSGKIKFDPAWTLTVTVADTSYTDYIVEQDEDVKVFKFESVGSGIKNKLSDVEFTLKGVKADKTQETLTVGDSANEYSVEITDTYTDVVFSKSYTVEVTVTLNGDGSTTEDKVVAKKTLTVNPTEDYITEYNVDFDEVYGESGDQPYTFEVGKTISTSKFVFTATKWASGNDHSATPKDNDLSSSDFKVIPDMIDYGWDTSKAFPISFEYKKDATVDADSNSVTQITWNN